MGLTHFDEAQRVEREHGHLHGVLDDTSASAAGSVGVGARRLEVVAGAWSTPAHEHGQEEEIFYVLAGRGISWQRGRTSEIGPGDCIVYLANRGAHTLYAREPLDVLAFGPRTYDESLGFPRLGMSIVGNRAVQSVPYVVQGAPIQFVREAAVGPPELPEPGPRPSTIVNVADVEEVRMQRPRIARTRRYLGQAAGSIRTGLNHVKVDPGRQATALHCHSVEEEMFVILDGAGTLELGEEQFPIRRGHVIARPPGTGVAHVLHAGDGGLTFLAYGTREPADIVYYPRSNKISFRGVGVIGRIERLDMWDGED